MRCRASGPRPRGGSAVLGVITLVVLGSCSGGGGSSAPDTGVIFPGPELTVKITALDTNLYRAGSITVKQGTIIHFVVKLAGKLRHEFVVGDKALQEAHESAMQQMCAAMSPSPCDMEMPDDAHGIDLRPGQTKTLTWIAAANGTFEYTCHEQGHYAAGMVGRIIVMS